MDQVNHNKQLLLFEDDEEWRDIVGYEGLYQVSNCGRVRSFNYRNKQETHILKLLPNKKGYYIVGLTKNCRRKTAVVHRLVANAFIPNPDNLPQINHKDEVKTNNYIDNLEWCTNSYNHNYGTHNERIRLANKGKKRTQESIENYKKSQERRRDRIAYRILQYDLNGVFIKEWRCAYDIEKELGFQRSSIRDCCNQKTKTFKGYIWRYKTENYPKKIYQINNENLKSVCQYNLKAVFIKDYPSINEAGRITGINPSCIRGCCSGKNKSAGGFIWKYKDDFKKVVPYHRIRIKGRSHHSAKAVLQFSITGEFIKEWECIVEASHAIGVTSTDICRCCKLRKKTSGGFIWRYKAEEKYNHKLNIKK